MTQIRPATPDDTVAMAALRYEFRAGIGEPTESPAAFEARCAGWMSAALRSGEWRAWVAEDDACLVGQIWMHVMHKVPNPVGEREHHAYLSNLYVQPAARGGTGTRLLQAALEWAGDHAVDRLVLWPTARSRSLYTRYGFTPVGDVMERTCP